ncbi:hypothetical protein SAY87_014173 [Trapa incisa]|uniref:Chaperone DnaJ C-terminal domain-containing protein n=1 Tax=Trapa incisa TaxID=236973 RepID=A0AAN7GVQ7_9MYRT|nr:hypothetical protein SAY87_014173 [Trapa incisa]
MAQTRSPKRSKDTSTLFGHWDKGKSSSLLDISKAYRFFTTKKHHQGHDRKRKENRDDASKESSGKKDNERISISEDATTPWEADDPSSHHRYQCNRIDSSIDDNFVFRRRSSILSKCTSRRSKTPTPSSFSRSASSRRHSVVDFLSSSVGSFKMKGSSMRAGEEPSDHPEATTNPTRCSRTPERTTTSTSFLRSTSIRTPMRMTSAAGPGPSSDNLSTPTSFSRTTSSVRRGGNATHIFFSQTAARKKSPPIERTLKCTLEELLHGCVKKVVIIRDVLSEETGMVQEEETLKINVEPGWRKGTKITFEGKGDEKPGYMPADIVYVVEEERHPLYKRTGDDLEIAVEIQLVQALTGCTLSVPLLGGEKMSLSMEGIIHPGYKKAIPGQGMPCSKEPGRRGSLGITFLVEFPVQLDEAQRLQVCSILRECEVDEEQETKADGD